MKETAAVVIPDEREQTAWAHQRFEIQRHSLQATGILFRQPDQNGVEQQHIQSVEMIIAGLLEVTAVRADLPFHLPADNLRSAPLPISRPVDAAEHESERVQSHGFPQQMGIRREVYGKV